MDNLNPWLEKLGRNKREAEQNKNRNRKKQKAKLAEEFANGPFMKRRRSRRKRRAYGPSNTLETI